MSCVLEGLGKWTWKKGAGKMMVQLLLLQGMKPARFRDAVKLQLA